MEKQWKNIIQQIHDERPSLGSVLELVETKSLEKGVFTIIYPKKYKFQKNIIDDKKTYLEEKISGILKHKIKIECSVSNHRQEDQEDQKSVDFIARQIAEKFNGEVII